ncbi:MAG TPA: hypothetical protein VGJ75_17055 [Dongiaceae bacterium]|jgi:hypothetical protein
MFDAFQRNFTSDPDRVPEAGEVLPNLGISGLNELIAQFGGTSFNKGLYGVVRASDVPEWMARISLGFPKFANRTVCFGYDWLGRAFAVDVGRLEQGQPGVLMLEPGTGEALEVPANIQTFHEHELMESGEAALAIDAHKRWLARGGVEPAYAECIGYKVPLFLSGVDEFGNMELSDLDVYWHIMGQLIVKTRELPEGTPIGRITIGD